MVELGARAGLEGGQADHRDANQVTIMDSASPEVGGGIGGLGHALMAEMRALREVVAGVVFWREKSARVRCRYGARCSHGLACAFAHTEAECGLFRRIVLVRCLSVPAEPRFGLPRAPLASSTGVKCIFRGLG